MLRPAPLRTTSADAVCGPLAQVVRIAGNLDRARYVQPDMTPEDRDALIEAGYDPDDPDVQARMLQVNRGLQLLRERWHDRSGLGHPLAEGPSAQQTVPAMPPIRRTRKPPCAPH
ncbi:hypothetical protein GCM10011610_25850 [Nocardia rhizosphaerihabitans]|uniref:Uncharacterized protein n=2 Tax=Nocardia rhizosphaerihabitans TaxID=1691570 RepID=A0ABQ2KG25_9NOCA|nr:hypothetical protein GCM10011610_25850 [Nocardia rhizosphaerihabitans]